MVPAEKAAACGRCQVVCMVAETQSSMCGVILEQSFQCCCPLPCVKPATWPQPAQALGGCIDVCLVVLSYAPVWWCCLMHLSVFVCCLAQGTRWGCVMMMYMVFKLCAPLRTQLPWCCKCGPGPADPLHVQSKALVLRTPDEVSQPLSIFGAWPRHSTATSAATTELTVQDLSQPACTPVHHLHHDLSAHVDMMPPECSLSFTLKPYWCSLPAIGVQQPT